MVYIILIHAFFRVRDLRFRDARLLNARRRDGRFGNFRRGDARVRDLGARDLRVADVCGLNRRSPPRGRVPFPCRS